LNIGPLYVWKWRAAKNNRSPFSALKSIEQMRMNAQLSGVPDSVFTFVDLFAGIGGTRIGFEQACKDLGFRSSCVFSSEIKPHAVETYLANFGEEEVAGDITEIEPRSVPDHDFLLAGFPCQPFSSAGKRKGFLDERGGLFFQISEILKAKRPKGFLLENVEGLKSHNGGETLRIILGKLLDLGYQVSHNVLDASDFDVPQQRKRIYIVGHQKNKVDLAFSDRKRAYIGDVLEDVPFTQSGFSKKLLEHYDYRELYGKSIKDKRGGKNNIHSWDIEIKGAISARQKELLNEILKKRRYKKWAEQKGIDWMDGMPLTFDEIKTFFDVPNLRDMLDDLVQKNYLVFEHPKKIVVNEGIRQRVFDGNAPKGYNIVAGKLSFPFSKILDPKGFAPTLVATEVGKIAVATPRGIRPITVREGLRISGFPEDYRISADYRKAFDLIGNTVIPPVIKAVSLKILENER